MLFTLENGGVVRGTRDLNFIPGSVLGLLSNQWKVFSLVCAFVFLSHDSGSKTVFNSWSSLWGKWWCLHAVFKW